MKRISLRIVLSLLVLIVALLALTLGLLFTQTGSRWLLDQVPGLTVEGWQGAVLTDWRAEQLHWQQDDVSVQLRDVHLQFRPQCLLRSAVCVDALEVARIDLNLPQTDESAEPQASITLPNLKLPLRIEIERVQIDELLLNGEPLLNNAA